MLYSKSINFHSYLLDYEFFKTYFSNHNRKRFKTAVMVLYGKTAVMVLYGKKKDRGHIKAKYEKALNEWRKDNALIYKALAQRFPFIKNYL